jgi:competence protein ComGC
MRQRTRDIGKDDRGFLLIESLIVVVIISVLTIVTLSIMAFDGKGIEVACQADVRSVELAAEAYFIETGSHTVDPDGAGVKTAIDVLLVDDYLKSKPSSGNYTVTLVAGVADGTIC